MYGANLILIIQFKLIELIKDLVIISDFLCISQRPLLNILQRPLLNIYSQSDLSSLQVLQLGQDVDFEDETENYDNYDDNLDYDDTHYND